MHFIKILILVIASTVTMKGYSQAGKAIPPARRTINEEIDKQLTTILKSFKSMDSIYNSSKGEELNSNRANSIISKVDTIQNNIEAGSSINEDKKVQFLKGLKEVLEAFEYNFKTHELPRINCPCLLMLTIAR